MKRNFKIRIENLSRQFEDGTNTIVVLKGINACFEQGKTYAIIGSSGTGKSTLLHLISGLDTPTSGTIFFDTEIVQSLSSVQRVSKIGLIFQSPYLIKELSVLENVMIAGSINGLKESECKVRALSLLKEMGLEKTKEWEVGALSGGQRQRVSIARALMNRPHFLIADEPTGNLDKENADLIIKMLLSCQKKEKMGLIVSSHDPLVTRQMGHAFVLKKGNLCEEVELDFVREKHSRESVL